jgi:hypothetical protein
MSRIEREIEAVSNRPYKNYILFGQLVTFVAVLHFTVVLIEKTESECDGL